MLDTSNSYLIPGRITMPSKGYGKSPCNCNKITSDPCPVHSTSTSMPQPELTNPHGTATRQDLLRLLYLVGDVLEMSDEEIEPYIDNLIRRLNISTEESNQRPTGSLNDVQGVIDVSDPKST